jgi:hypothetical protein
MFHKPMYTKLMLYKLKTLIQIVQHHETLREIHRPLGGLRPDYQSGFLETYKDKRNDQDGEV